MEIHEYHSPVSSEKSKKSPGLYVEDEVEVTEADFQYVSLKKMNYVHWTVRRKIQKEKEQQMWLDYARRLPDFRETAEELTVDFNETRHCEMKCYTAKCQQIVSERGGKSTGNVVHRSCQPVGKAECQNQSQIPKTNSYTLRKLQKNATTKEIQSHCRVQSEIANVSPRLKFGNNEQHLRSIMKGPAHVSSFEKSKFRASSSNKMLPVLSTDNYSKPKPSNKSYAFSSLCSHIWQKLLINEEDEERLFLRLQEINKEQSRNDVKNTALDSKKTALSRKPIINKPMKKVLQKPTLVPESTLKFYDVCDKSDLVKRLSDTIVIDLLNQVCKEFNNLSEIFLCELFEKEFQLSNLISK